MPAPHGPMSAPAHDHSGTPPAAPDRTPPTVASVVDQVFTRFDANSDGSITTSEIVAKVDPDGDSSSAHTQAAAVVAAADSSGNGALEKTEVTALVTKLDTDQDGSLERSDRSDAAADSSSYDVAGVLLGRGPGGHGGHGGHGGPEGHDGGDGDGTPPTPPAEKTLAEVSTQLFDRYDTNSDASIALSEVVAVVDPDQDSDPIVTDITGLFPTADSNGDNALSSTEVMSVLSAMDGDASGTLSRQEIHAEDADGTAVELVGVLLHAHPHAFDHGE